MRWGGVGVRLALTDGGVGGRGGCQVTHEQEDTLVSGGGVLGDSEAT